MSSPPSPSPSKNSTNYGGSTGPGALLYPPAASTHQEESHGTQGHEHGHEHGHGTQSSSSSPSPSSSSSSSFTSLSVREVLHDSEEVERKGMAIRRMLRFLSPQLLENPLTLMITDMSTSKKLRTVVDQASDAG